MQIVLMLKVGTRLTVCILFVVVGLFLLNANLNQMKTTTPEAPSSTMQCVSGSEYLTSSHCWWRHRNDLLYLMTDHRFTDPLNGFVIAKVVRCDSYILAIEGECLHPVCGSCKVVVWLASVCARQTCLRHTWTRYRMESID